MRRLKQFSSVLWPIGSLVGEGGGHEGWFSRDPVPVFFCRRPLWAVLAWAGMSTLWCCSSSISYADHGVAHPLRCPEGWFWRGCHGMWHVWAIPPLTSNHLCWYLHWCCSCCDLPLFCGDFHSICRCSVYESAGEVLKFTIAAAHKINVVSRLHMAFHQWRWMCGGCGVFPAWSSPGTSWTGWVRVSIHDGTLTIILKISSSWLFKRAAGILI